MSQREKSPLGLLRVEHVERRRGQALVAVCTDGSASKCWMMRVASSKRDVKQWSSSH